MLQSMGSPLSPGVCSNSHARVQTLSSPLAWRVPGVAQVQEKLRNGRGHIILELLTSFNGMECPLKL